MRPMKSPEEMEEDVDTIADILTLIIVGLLVVIILLIIIDVGVGYMTAVSMGG